jgi:hypothetical protein
MGLLVGPLGFALGGLTAVSITGNVAVPFTPTAGIQPLAPAVAAPAAPLSGVTP